MENNNKCLKPSKRSIKDAKQATIASEKRGDFIPDAFIDAIPSLRKDDNTNKKDEEWDFICCNNENFDTRWHKCSNIDCIYWYHRKCLKIVFNFTNNEIKRISKTDEFFDCPHCKCSKMMSKFSRDNKQPSKKKLKKGKRSWTDANNE